MIHRFVWIAELKFVVIYVLYSITWWYDKHKILCRGDSGAETTDKAYEHLLDRKRDHLQISTVVEIILFNMNMMMV